MHLLKNMIVRKSNMRSQRKSRLHSAAVVTVEMMESRRLLSGTPITAWNFDNTAAQTATLAPPPSTGSGTAASVGMSQPGTTTPGLYPTAGAVGPDISAVFQATATADQGSSDPGSTFIWRVRGSNGWNTAAGIGTQGAQFSASTAGYNSINARFDIYLTTAGEGKFQVEYTTDGTNWTNVPASLLGVGSNSGIAAVSNSSSPNTVQGGYFSVTGGQKWYNGLTVDLSGINAVNNNPNFGLRIVNAATGSDDTVSNGTTLENNTSGNWRLDEVQILGTVAAPAPTITTQPTSQSVLIGNTVTFTAGANGATSDIWQSSPDGTTWTDISGATSTSYSFTVTAANNGMQYRCVFTNANGSTPTNAATLTALTAIPTITTNPISQNVNAGGTVNLIAAASGTPTPTVQWQISTDSGTTFTNIGGATSPTYSFTANEGMTGDQFRAVFTNSAGGTNTNAATITVVGTPIAQWVFTGGEAPPPAGSTAQGTGNAPYATFGPLTNTAGTLGLNNDYTGIQAVPESDILIERSTLNAGYSEYDWRVRSGNGQGPTGSPGTPEGWSQDAPQYSQGVIFKIDTTGYSNITFSFDWNQGGIADLQPQYSPDAGKTWINAPSGVITAQGSDFYGITNSTTFAIPIVVNLQSVAAANNNPNFQLRLVASYNANLPLINDGNQLVPGLHGQYATGAPGPVNAQQVIQFGNDLNSFNDVTGGTFTLTYDGATTAPISFDSNPTTLAANITTALDALTVNGVANALMNNFTVSQTNPLNLNPERDGLGVTASDMTVTFTGTLAATAIDTMTANGSALTGSNPSISVATWVNGSANGFTPYVDGGGALQIGKMSFNGDSNQSGGLAVTTEPQPTSVAGGGTAIFSASAYSETVPTTAQWQVSNNGGATWGNIVGATNIIASGSTYTSTFSFTTSSSLTDNGHQFRVVFSAGSSSVASSGATLTVVAPTAPTIVVQPSPTSVQTGNVTTITATANKNTAPAPSVQWQISTDGGATWSNVSDGATYLGSQTTTLSAAGYVATLSITSAASLNGDRYRAVFSNSAGSVASNGVTLSVLDPETDITNWDFTNHPTSGTGTFDNSPVPTGGVVDIGTASMVGMTLPYNSNDPATGIDGNGSVDAGDVTNTPGALNPSFNENTWRIRGGPTPTTGGTPANGWSNFMPEYSQGVQFSVPTSGYSKIYVTMDWYATTSGILDAQPQYTIDGAHWINLGPQVQAVSNDFYGATPTGAPIPLVFDVSSLAGANDNGNFGIRLVSANNPLLPNITDENGTHGQYANAALVGNPPGPAPYNGSKGNWRFDNIEFHGVSNSPTLPAWLSTDSQATWDSTSHMLFVSGNATIIANPGSDKPVVNVGTGGNLIVHPANSGGIQQLAFAAINISAGAKVVFATSSATLGDYSHHANRNVAVVDAGGLNISFGGFLDMGDNSMILKYVAANKAATDTMIQGLLASAADIGGWDGTTGIGSSEATFDAAGSATRAVGWADQNDVGNVSFEGDTADVADGNEIMIKFTYTGDTDLSGTVDGTDSANFSLGLHGFNGGNAGWEFGDFDYSGGKPNSNDSQAFSLGLHAYKAFGAL